MSYSKETEISATWAGMARKALPSKTLASTRPARHLKGRFSSKKIDKEVSVELSVSTRSSLRLCTLPAVAVLLAGCVSSPEIEADLVLRGGKVVTVDEDVAEGQAIAVKGDTILAVGSNRQIRAYIGPNT